jgi:putative oxidoreductase
MHKFLGKFSDQLYALMRIVVGYTFLWHGAQKLLGAAGGNQVELVSRMGLAGAVELFGGVLILIGLFASWAAFIASGEMAVAYFLAHASQGSPLLPIVNHGELAVVYCFVFLYIASRGAGKWSIAAALGKDSLA